MNIVCTAMKTCGHASGPDIIISKDAERERERSKRIILTCLRISVSLPNCKANMGGFGSCPSSGKDPSFSVELRTTGSPFSKRSLRPSSSPRDADSVYFVANGRGMVNFVRQDRKETFNIWQGDVVRVKAGTTYLINSDKNERLIMAKVLVPVNAPGEFQSYFGVGGQNPESFYKAFSSEILQAALNTRSDRVERLFGQQKQGFIIKASEEQIRSLSCHAEGGICPFGGEPKSTFNLYQQRPTYFNQYGQLYEVDSSQFRQLRDLDISVSLANITQGAMTAPTITLRQL